MSEAGTVVPKPSAPGPFLRDGGVQNRVADLMTLDTGVFCIATIAADTSGSMPSTTILCFCSAVQRRRLPQVPTAVPRSRALVRSVVRAAPVCKARFAMPSSSVSDDIWH
jgi:hypothetical protein